MYEVENSLISEFEVKGVAIVDTYHNGAGHIYIYTF
jgi:hypothetical protein